MARKVRLGAIAVAVVLLIAWVGVGWYFAGQVIALPTVTAAPTDTVVVDLQGVGDFREITLRAPAGSAASSTPTAGLELPGGGFVQLGPIRSTAKGLTTRDARLIKGVWPPGGTKLAGSEYGWPPDPTAALGTSVASITIPSKSGGLPAWMAPGPSKTWIVYVHGRGADRRESLNIMRVGSRLGYPGLSVEYHGAPDGPKSDDGKVHFGLTEWHDVQAAVDYLKATQHAAHFVLVGYSMGGGIVSQFLAHSPDAKATVATILDAPLLDLNETLALRARNYGIPGPLVPPILASTEAIATFRADLDFDELNAVPVLAHLNLPILLFHGTQDTSVPISTSRALAKAGPEHVTYVECRAEHVRCWNADPAAYENAVAAFLQARVG